jgi:hypothetical protein
LSLLPEEDVALPGGVVVVLPPDDIEALPEGTVIVADGAAVVLLVCAHAAPATIRAAAATDERRNFIRAILYLGFDLPTGPLRSMFRLPTADRRLPRAKTSDGLARELEGRPMSH